MNIELEHYNNNIIGKNKIHGEHVKRGFPNHGDLLVRSKYSDEEKFLIEMESSSENVRQDEICRCDGIYSARLSKWRGQFI